MVVSIPSSDNLPLQGKRFLLTCPPDENRERFMADLCALGAEVVSLPLIEVVPVDFIKPTLAGIDWLFFTSKNAVRAFFHSLQNDKSDWADVPVAVVGPGTEKTLMNYGLLASFVSPVHDAASAARLFMERYQTSDLNILWPCGNLAEQSWLAMLAAHGGAVRPLVVYETKLHLTLSEPERLALKTPYDCVVFTSPSAVSAFQQGANLAFVSQGGTLFASIGPKTTQAIQAILGQTAVQADPYTFTGLAKAIRQYYGLPEAGEEPMEGHQSGH